jgi:hypothetical protein
MVGMTIAGYILKFGAWKGMKEAGKSLYKESINAVKNSWYWCKSIFDY